MLLYPSIGLISGFGRVGLNTSTKAHRTARNGRRLRRSVAELLAGGVCRDAHRVNIGRRFRLGVTVEMDRQAGLNDLVGPPRGTETIPTAIRFQRVKQQPINAAPCLAAPVAESR
jgi:hypothetical protein